MGGCPLETEGFMETRDATRPWGQRLIYISKLSFMRLLFNLQSTSQSLGSVISGNLGGIFSKNVVLCTSMDGVSFGYRSWNCNNELLQRNPFLQLSFLF